MKIKKSVSLMLAIICMFSLVACGKEEIQLTKKPFPEFNGTDFDDNILNNDMFKDYDATIINFWTNGCGTCIEEMPELEEYYHQFKDMNVNLIGVAVSACDSKEEYDLAESILKKKGVTYPNLITEKDSSFHKDFIGDITGYPKTYIVDSDGNIVGAAIVGVVKNQEKMLMKRLDDIKEGK